MLNPCGDDLFGLGSDRERIFNVADQIGRQAVLVLFEKLVRKLLRRQFSIITVDWAGHSQNLSRPPFFPGIGSDLGRIAFSYQPA